MIKTLLAYASAGWNNLRSGILADPAPDMTRWDGSFCDQLILWDDQGFGDTLQNLGWILKRPDVLAA